MGINYLNFIKGICPDLRLYQEIMIKNLLSTDLTLLNRLYPHRNPVFLHHEPKSVSPDDEFGGDIINIVGVKNRNYRIYDAKEFDPLEKEKGCGRGNRTPYIYYDKDVITEKPELHFSKIREFKNLYVTEMFMILIWVDVIYGQRIRTPFMHGKVTTPFKYYDVIIDLDDIQSLNKYLSVFYELIYYILKEEKKDLKVEAILHYFSPVYDYWLVPRSYSKLSQVMMHDILHEFRVINNYTDIGGE